MSEQDGRWDEPKEALESLAVEPLDSCKGLLSIEKFEDVKKMRAMCIALWDLIDLIDAASDQAGTNDKWYRKQVERIQQKRFKWLVSDGYDLFVPKELMKQEEK